MKVLLVVEDAEYLVDNQGECYIQNRKSETWELNKSKKMNRIQNGKHESHKQSTRKILKRNIYMTPNNLNSR